MNPQRAGDNRRGAQAIAAPAARRWRVAPAVLVFSLLSSIAAAADAAPPMPRTGLLPMAAAFIASLWEVIGPIWAAAPTIPAELAKTTRAIAATSVDGIWFGLGNGALAVGALFVASAYARRRAARIVDRQAPSDPLLAICSRFFLDVIAVLGILFLALWLSELLFRGNDASTALAAAFVDIAVRFRLAALVPAILFRPDEPQLRLMRADEAQVSRGKPYFLAALFVGLSFPALIPVWLAAGMNWNAGQALAVIVGAVVALLGYLAVAGFLSASATLWPRWRPFAMAAAAGFWLVWAYGVVTLDFPFFFALVTLTTIGIVALILDRFLAVALRLAAMGESESGGHYRFWRNYGTALRRSVDVLAVSAAAMVIVGWVAEVSPMLFGAWHMLDFHHRLLNALAVFGFGYLVFEFLMAWTRTKFTAPVAIAHPGSDESEEPTPASRLATIMPLLQGFVGVAILAISAVVALAKLGVDTTPLLAGAGIFGLAISFGSQSLVRDIVAGIFYMADDAFRLGEYIEAGRLKGAVEKISLRSVRLRHSSGQIHTVPFGQLGSVTNFSRDWVTMKFNLRLARNIDIDFVRKTVKKIGLDLLEDEEIGKDFLQPLKMQGVADIQENALVLRFKFTVRPGKPTYIQRIAMKRIVTTFAEKGIAFATHSLFIQNAADSEADTDEIAAHPISAALAGIPPRPGA